MDNHHCLIGNPSTNQPFRSHPEAAIGRASDIAQSLGCRCRSGNGVQIEGITVTNSNEQGEIMGFHGIEWNLTNNNNLHVDG